MCAAGGLRRGAGDFRGTDGYGGERPRLGSGRHGGNFRGHRQSLTVVLNGCIAYEVDSAGGSLKTAIAAADLVVYLAEEDVPADLGGRDRRLAAEP